MVTAEPTNREQEEYLLFLQNKNAFTINLPPLDAELERNLIEHSTRYKKILHKSKRRSKKSCMQVGTSGSPRKCHKKSLGDYLKNLFRY